jgi:tRNA (guanosine-2'-O-)-methyltransferase
MDAYLSRARRERIRQVLRRRQKDLTLVMDNIWDPHNVSAILRSCDAFGVLEVQLYYTREAFPAIGKKSSASARKWVERARWRDAHEMARSLRSRGCAILATGFSDTARPLPQWDLARPCAIVLSNEHSGISPEIAALADGELYIPMMGMIPSLNVSVAAAVILYEAWRQRWEKGAFDECGLSPEEFERMYALWASK